MLEKRHPSLTGKRVLLDKCRLVVGGLTSWPSRLQHKPLDGDGRSLIGGCSKVWSDEKGVVFTI